MRALILDSAASTDGITTRVRAAMVETLASRRWETETLTLRDMQVADCVGCFGCWVKTPGECLIRDDAQAVTRRWINSDLVVLLSPVTFGGYSSELKKVMDRSICLVSPFFTRIDGEVHHRPRYARYPRLAMVGTQPAPDPDAVAIFETLAARNAINLWAPAHAVTVLDPTVDERHLPGRMRQLLDALEVAE